MTTYQENLKSNGSYTQRGAKFNNYCVSRVVNVEVNSNLDHTSEPESDSSWEYYSDEDEESPCDVQDISYDPSLLPPYAIQSSLQMPDNSEVIRWMEAVGDPESSLIDLNLAERTVLEYSTDEAKQQLFTREDSVSANGEKTGIYRHSI